MAYTVSNASGYTHFNNNTRIPATETRATEESAAKRARAHLAKLGATDIKEVRLWGMLVLDGGNARKFIVEPATDY